MYSNDTKVLTFSQTSIKSLVDIYEKGVSLVTKYAPRANVLEKDNSVPYAPTSQYHPATKAYADSIATSGGGNVAVTKIFEFVASANQTTFNIYSGYILGSIQVVLNGRALVSTDYTAGDGSNVVLTVGASVNDEIIIVVYGGADVYNKTQSDLRYEVNGGDVNTVFKAKSAISSSDVVNKGQLDSSFNSLNSAYNALAALVNNKITASDYATSTKGGTLKVRFDGTTLHIRNDGNNA